MSIDLYQFGTIQMSEDTREISISDTKRDKKIVDWIKVGNQFWSAYTLFPGIKKTELENQGYTRGKFVEIDGKKYLCRLPYIGAGDGAGSEWKDVLEATTEDDDVWHWNRRYFWGQEMHGTRSSWVCGYVTALTHDVYPSDDSWIHVGFRPVLEPLPDKFQIDSSLKRKSVTLYFSDGPLLCTVSDLSDYDLFVIPKDKGIKPGPWGISMPENVIAVDRDAILCLIVQ